MEWIIIGILIVLLLPFYMYILSKSVHMGRLMAIKQLFKEEANGEKDESGKE